MALTLNQIIARLRTLALSHDQINSFYQGDPWEFDSNGDVTFPALFLEPVAGVIDRTERLTKYGFKCYFLDLVKVANDTEGNEQEVLSDMASVAEDFIAMLNYSGYQDDWLIEQRSSLSPVTEALNDMAAGQVLEIVIEVEFLSDRCQVPASEIVFEDDDGGIVLLDPAKKPRTLTYTSVGDSGDSFTVPSLAGKFVIAAFRAGSYKRVSVNATTDSEIIRVHGAQQTGGIVATGTVDLEDGDTLINDEKLDFIYYG
jgi:hypothetical protein